MRIDRHLQAMGCRLIRDVIDDGHGFLVVVAGFVLGLAKGHPNHASAVLEHRDGFLEGGIIGLLLVREGVNVESLQLDAMCLTGGKPYREILGLGVVVTDAVVTELLEGAGLLLGRPRAAADGVVESEKAGRLGSSERLRSHEQGEDGFHGGFGRWV
jgi:hypothetical protein